jgi:hypothetical protein
LAGNPVKCGFGGMPGLFCGVLSAELEHEPDPPISFSSWSRPTTEIGSRYFGAEIGDASWSESQNRRAIDDDVRLDELSVSSVLLLK